MIHRQIEREIDGVASRYRTLRSWWTLSATWLAAAVCGVALVCAHGFWGWYSPWWPTVLIVATLAASAVCLAVTRGAGSDRQVVARRIESCHTELGTRLLAAIEQSPSLPGGRFGFLQETLMREVLRHARRHPWRQTVPDRSIRRAQFANVTAFTLLVVVLVGLTTLRARPPATVDLAGPGTIESPGAPDYSVEIDPGTVELERGSSLLVLARFSQAVPPEATLVLRNAASEERRILMAKSLDDPVFGGRIAEVSEDIEYRVEYVVDESPTYRVSVFDFPALLKADAEIRYPEYTGQEATTVTDTRRVSAVEGTELTWRLHLNKPVERAWLEDKNDRILTLALDDPPTVRSASMTLQSSNRYIVHLLDDRGRENREPPTLDVRVIPNQRPDLTVVSPARDVAVSPLEELTIAAKVWDDFGLKDFGVSFALAGEEPRDVSLGDEAPGKETRELRHVLEFEAFGAQPDQLLSYFFWAEDVGPDGRPRRTFSDMYFAEVRPFEEIFRQGEQPAGGEEQPSREPQQQEEGSQEGQGNAQDAQELAELQKQIVNGTWKLIRASQDSVNGDPSDGDPSDGDPVNGDQGLLTDGALLRDSQQSALDQAGSLGERIEDAESMQHLEAVLTHMGDALERLGEAVDRLSPEPLGPALAAEQSAYQALLRLRAREHVVVQSRSDQPSNPSSRSGTRSQQQRQLQQLQLSNTQNRYETQRTAREQATQSEAQREDRQVLDRLQELARRQADLNERLQELQSALAEAQDQAEREELERRLKRLRDEQQQVLRDTDELAQRMDQPQNQQRMSDAREQLQDTRENVRQASEALREGQVSRAASAGTRAERELQELSDEFRERTSQQFADAMREMRSDAEDLERSESELGRRLEEMGESRERSLRGANEREQIQEGFEAQEKKLDELLERIEEVVQEAETPEPLLSEKLYDTLRQTRHERTEDYLDVTRELLERGFVDEATEVEQRVEEGVRQLRRGVDDAASSVLGDEADALRRARQELDRLTDDVEREIARAQPGERQPGQGERQPGQGEPQPGQGERQPGQGERQPGQGEPQPGQGEPQPGQGEPQPGQLARGQGETPPRGLRGGGDPNGLGGLEPFLGGGPEEDRELSPIAGEDFREWSERLRDVEEMIDDPELRTEAARVLERARGVRSDVKRHSEEPNWDLVRMSIVDPLKELRRRVHEQLLLKESPDALVPIDRDPVPPEYTESVREYYERLGSGR